METKVQEWVNLGLGAYSSAQEQATKVIEETQARMNELITIGESNTAENAVKAREFVSKAAKSAEELQERATAFVDEIVGRVKDLDPRQTEEAAAPAEAK